MLEIIPNWHPIFVHFTVALFSLAVGLFVVTRFVKPPLQEQWLIVARWTLWFGAGFTVVTALTGLYAFNTVDHDTPSHVAMTEHRDWAMATITLFMTLAIWSFIRVRRQQALGTVFVVAMAVAGGALASTAWHGGEAVYRYGLGVKSLPKSEGKGHSHEHADGEGHSHGHGNEISDSDGATSMSDSVQAQHHDEADNHEHNAVAHSHSDMVISEPNTGNDNMNSMQNDHHDDGHVHEH